MRTIAIMALLSLTSCQWAKMHPKEENDMLQLAEDVAHDMFIGDYPPSK